MGNLKAIGALAFDVGSKLNIPFEGSRKTGGGDLF